MRTHIGPLATVLALCLALPAAAAFAGDPPGAPPPPAAPPLPAGSVTVPNPPGIHEDELRARMEAAHRREEAAQKREAALQARMDAARHRLEAAAQELAALSAQKYGPMMQHFQAFAGPPHALVGVQLDDSSGEAGARVREVSPGGPAAQAGMRAGDLIVAVNGTDVKGAEPARHVIELLRGVKPGDKVHISVLRDGKTRDLTVTARPDREGIFIARRLPDLPPLPHFKWGGAPMIIRGPVADMELARLTPALGRYFGTDTGVLVVRAPPDGALGLQDGDVILSIGGRKPIDGSHVVRILASYDPGEKISMEVMRLHRRIPVAATLPADPATPRAVFMRGAATGPGAAISVRGGDRPL